MDIGMNAFISKLFEARQQAHVMHLRTNSYEVHMALDTFYNEILGLIDDLAETFMGQYGQIRDYSPIIIKDIDPIVYLEGLANILKDFPTLNTGKDSHLQNIVDEITGLTFRTLYKLKYLK